MGLQRRLDRSKKFSRRIEDASRWLSKRRGVVPVAGIGIVTVGVALLLVNVFVDIRLLEFTGILLQGVGTLTALIGLLLIEPLGS